MEAAQFKAEVFCWKDLLYRLALRLLNNPSEAEDAVQKIKWINTKWYVDWIHIPYIRWFPKPVKRGDVLVFNFPANDTLIDDGQHGSLVTYYQEIRGRMLSEHLSEKEARQRTLDQYGDLIITRPFDERELFVKRCVGGGGDTLQIKNRIVYINGVAQTLPEYHEFNYLVTSTSPLDPD